MTVTDHTTTAQGDGIVEDVVSQLTSYHSRGLHTLKEIGGFFCRFTEG